MEPILFSTSPMSPACLVIMPSLLFFHLRAPVLVLEIVFLYELVEHLLLHRLHPFIPATLKDVF